MDLFREASVPESAWDTMIGLSGGEAGHFADAVGDVNLVGVDSRGVHWLPSVSNYQIRCLLYPNNYGIADRVRDIEKLRPYNPDGSIRREALVFAAHAAWTISENGTRWDKWSVHPTSRHNRVNKDPNGEMIETDATRRYWAYFGNRNATLNFGHPTYPLWNNEGKAA